METIERHDRIADATKSAANVANNVADKGAHFAQQVLDKGADFKKAVVDKGSEALKHSEKFIKENPHTSVMSGFGLGVLIGGAIVFLMMNRD